MARVMHVLLSGGYSGAENVAATIALLEKENEHIYVSPPGVISSVLERLGIRHVEVPRVTPSAISRVIREHCPNVVHAHDIGAATIVALDHLVHRHYRLLTHIHCNHPNMRRVSVRSLLLLFVNTQSDALFVVSRPVIDDYLFKKWIKTPTVLPNVVNEELIMESSRKSLAKNIDVVFLARLTHPKNPLGFIDVIAGVRKSIPGLKVVVIGDGELAEQTKAKTVGEGLEDVVEFLGFQANPYPYVKQARICVLTSVWEGYPMSALEAMLLGVPIVCTDVGGLPQMVNDSVGRVCTTLAQIEEEVIHLLSDPKYLEEKTAKTTDHARQINNVKGFKQILSSTYHRLAEMSR